MNNEQFRRLMLANSASTKQSNGKPSPSGVKGNGLGSRQRSSIPMTPRSLGNTQADFARQVAERNRATHPPRKFKSAAPKGSKLADGYVDRSKQTDEDHGDERVEKLQTLEKSYKAEEIDKETYERLRSQYAGGDLESTHLVKGLDFKLLKRIREGEDVYNAAKEPEESETVLEEQAEEEADVDDELDALEAKEVQLIERGPTEKKQGQISTVSLVPGKKRTRDQILAELKAAREAAKAEPESTLGEKFSKIGMKRAAGTRLEKDAKGRAVMIIVDAEGNEKRKVRKVQTNAGEKTGQSDMALPDKAVAPLGMEVPEYYRTKEEPEEDEDVNIFDSVGDDYDPLADMDGSDSESSNDDEDKHNKRSRKDADPDSGTKEDQQLHSPPEPAASRNYFQGSRTGLVSEEASKAPSMSDPAIMAAIKKAAAIHPIGGVEGDQDAAAKDEQEKARERRRKMLESSNRDDEDMDLGFGTSRFEDEEDFDGTKVKLSKWGDDDNDEAGGSRGRQGKRKRGPKKKKGDGNNAADVLRVMEQRKKS